MVVLARSGGESHFEVEFGPSGGRTRVVVGGYFENGYVGSFRVRMTRDTVRATESRISASGYWAARTSVDKELLTPAQTMSCPGAGREVYGRGARTLPRNAIACSITLNSVP